MSEERRTAPFVRTVPKAADAPRPATRQPKRKRVEEVATELWNLAFDLGLRLHRDAYGHVCASVIAKPGGDEADRHTFDLDSRHSRPTFQGWLMYRYHFEYGTVPSLQAVKMVIDIIKTECSLK